MIEIKNSDLNDVENILEFYREAIAYQKKKNGIPWQITERSSIEKEVKENRQYKLLVGNEIACIWVVAFNDHEIWGDKDSEPSVYLHRIATNPKFRGRNLVSEVITWAKGFALKNHKRYLRLDTAGINPGLITKYVQNGFKFIDTTEIGVSDSLPAHYHNAQICLFEMNLHS